MPLAPPATAPPRLRPVSAAFWFVWPPPPCYTAGTSGRYNGEHNVGLKVQGFRLLVTQVKLPKLGSAMEDARLIQYRVEHGQHVTSGQALFEIETDKAAVEVESPADGFVRHIFVQPGTVVLPGQPVLIIADKDEPVPADLIEAGTRAAAAASTPPRPAPADPHTPQHNNPAEAATVTTPQHVKLGQTVRLSARQRATAAKMLRSKREIPCFYLNVRADVTDLVELRSRLNRTSPVRIAYDDFIIAAVAKALENYPLMAGRLAQDLIELPDTFDVAFAVDSPGGVVAPVLRNVNAKDLTRLASERADLQQKALLNKLTPDDLAEPCITISNLGMYRVTSFIPIVVPGQCCILGIGRITDTCVPDVQPSPAGPRFLVRKLMALTLSVDHRIANGAYASQFLDHVKKTLEDTNQFA